MSEALARPRKRHQKSVARLAEMADAAALCFSEAGFRRTQVADIARRMGVSAGTIYLYADSKEALLHLAFMHLTGEDLTALQTPFADPGIEATASLITRKMKESAFWPELTTALETGAAPTRDLLEIIGAALYDRLAEQCRMIWLLDGCNLDIPELNIVYRSKIRGAYMADLATLMDRLPNTNWTAPQKLIAIRGAIEIIAWAAMHRRREQELPDEFKASEEETRTAAARSFASALLGMADKI